ncbi:hypothetical protein ACLOJK_005663 [Asimina triloba]
MNPKISDFGLARIVEGDESKVNTKRVAVAGTYGYMAPEYALDGIFSDISDVYSYGVLLLAIVSGKRNTGFYPYKNSINLLGYAWQKKKKKAKIEARSARIENPGKGGFFGTGIEQGWRVQLQEVMTVGWVGKVVVQGPTEVYKGKANCN